MSSYIYEHDLSKVVKKAVNHILREKPTDPISAIAGQLIKSATHSYPVFSKFEARRIFLNDNLHHESI